MGVLYSPKIVTDGLVFCLDAGNTKSYPGSGTTWTDLSTNGNNGTLINGPTFNSLNGGSIAFDGVDDRGTFTTPITSSSNQTYEIWTNAVGSTGIQGWGYLLHNNGASVDPEFVGTSYLTIAINGSTNRYVACLNGNFAGMDTDVVPNNSNIVQIVLTWDGALQKAYINNVLKASQSLTTTPQNFSTTTSFGDYRASTYRPMLGNIYSIKIYNKAFTEAEISQNFNALRGRYGI